MDHQTALEYLTLLHVSTTLFHLGSSLTHHVSYRKPFPPSCTPHPHTILGHSYSCRQLSPLRSSTSCFCSFSWLLDIRCFFSSRLLSTHGLYKMRRKCNLNKAYSIFLGGFPNSHPLNLLHKRILIYLVHRNSCSQLETLLLY